MDVHMMCSSCDTRMFQLLFVVSKGKTYDGRVSVDFLQVPQFPPTVLCVQSYKLLSLPVMTNEHNTLHM